MQTTEINSMNLSVLYFIDIFTWCRLQLIQNHRMEAASL